jgi:putative component of toxin-antitoxin plasmid stabilization module
VSDDDGVTLGEVNRNVVGLRGDLREITKDVIELRVQTGTTADKTVRLERIVYGALATGTAALITAVVSAINTTH